MSVEVFLEGQRQLMIARARHEVVDWSVDHLPAHPLMRRIAVGLALTAVKGPEAERAFYDQLHRDMLERLAQDGVEAELYKLRGKVTADYETDSRVFLRVTGRNGVETGAKRRADRLCRAVVLATTEDVVLSKRGEE